MEARLQGGQRAWLMGLQEGCCIIGDQLARLRGQGRHRGQSGIFSREACEVGELMRPNGVLLVCPKSVEPERAARGKEPVDRDSFKESCPKGWLLVKLCSEMDSRVPRLASVLKKRKASRLPHGGREVRGLGLLQCTAAAPLEEGRGCPHPVCSWLL